MLLKLKSLLARYQGTCVVAPIAAGVRGSNVLNVECGAYHPGSTPFDCSRDCNCGNCECYECYERDDD